MTRPLPAMASFPSASLRVIRRRAGTTYPFDRKTLIIPNGLWCLLIAVFPSRRARRSAVATSRAGRPVGSSLEPDGVPSVRSGTDETLPDLLLRPFPSMPSEVS